MPRSTGRTPWVGLALMVLGIASGVLYALLMILSLAVPPMEYYPVARYTVRIVRDAEGLRALDYGVGEFVDDAVYSTCTESFTAEVEIERPVPSSRGRRGWGSYNRNYKQPSADAIARAGPQFGVTVSLRGSERFRIQALPVENWAWPPEVVEKERDFWENASAELGLEFFRTTVMDATKAKEVLAVVASDIALQSGNQKYADAVREGGITKPSLSLVFSADIRQTAKFTMIVLAVCSVVLGRRLLKLDATSAGGVPLIAKHNPL